MATNGNGTATSSRAALSQETGATGLSYGRGGIITEEILPQLQGRDGIKVYRDMGDNDPVVGAIMFTIEMLVRQVNWTTEQNDANEKDVEFLESCKDDMSHSWGDFMAEILSMIRFGFSFHEIVYKKRLGPQPEGGRIPTSKYNDGKVGWRKIPIRSQDSLDHWEFDDDGGIKAYVQKPAPDYQDKIIPITKGLLFRPTSYKNNPEGRSMLRNAYRPWYFKKRIEEIEGVGIERDMAGFPTFWLPSDYLASTSTPEQKAVVNSFMTLGTNIRRDKAEYLLMPLAYDDNNNKLFDFSLVASSGTRTFDTDKVIGRYNQNICMTALADFLLLGHEKVGSFALSSDKTDLFAVAIGTVLDSIEDVLNRFAIPRLWQLNGMNLEKMPTLKHGDIEDPDLTVLGTFLQILNGIGMPLFPDPTLEDWVRNVAHLPEQSEEGKQAQEEKAAQAQQIQTGGQPGVQGNQGPGQPGAGQDQQSAQPADGQGFFLDNLGG